MLIWTGRRKAPLSQRWSVRWYERPRIARVLGAVIGAFIGAALGLLAARLLVGAK